ncbi:MAG: response regulator transcription factor, partial [Clostridiales bacterium]|nr:response regulator transcription factor [Clostridiales bacterium]
MIRIGICDDDSRARDALRWSLERQMDADGEQIIYDFSSGEGVVQWLKKHPGQMDLLFLDVEMEPCSGLEAARQIRQFNETLWIVFVTGFADFVFEGYRVQALDYLLKPVEEARLAEVLTRVRRALAQGQDRCLTIRNTEGVYRLNLEEILYCYSDRRKVMVVLERQKIGFYGKLDELEARLGRSFVRIHQRYLVRAA